MSFACQVCEYLDVRSLSRLFRTCKTLAKYANPASLLGFYIGAHKAALVEYLTSVRICQIGVVLAHQYSLDGQSFVPWGHIRGRDA